jgi:DNA/RNA-binding domain of Phe-tRNA-synthetase-like protein
MPISVLKQINDPRLMLGVVEIKGGTVREASTDLKSCAGELAKRFGAADYEIPEAQRKAVRELLKLGGFSPTGRNRPAQELLINDLKERGEFHYINNAVDVNNVVSLETLLPISIFDRDKLTGPVIVRLAEEGEGYVFNASGQYMDLKRCIVCCHSAPGGEAKGTPVGSPVKDSMETKIFEGAAHYLGVIYFPTALMTTYSMTSATQRFANLLAVETGGHIRQAVLV